MWAALLNLHMGKIIDISSKLVNEPKFLQVAEGKTYKVDDRKNTVLKMNELLDGGSASAHAIDKAIKLGLGEKAFKEIEAMNLSITAYQSLFIGMMALMMDKSYEDMNKTFRSSTE